MQRHELLKKKKRGHPHLLVGPSGKKIFFCIDEMTIVIEKLTHE